MAGISYLTHYYCTNCDKHFLKSEFPDQIWCPTECGRRLRNKPRHLNSAKKKNREAYGVARY